MEIQSDIPQDVRAFVCAVTNLLEMYMPGKQRITMLVGRAAEAELSFTGGPVTREMIDDVIAHLAFYKKYFPKESEGGAVSAETVVRSLEAVLAEHRAQIAASPSA